MGLPRMSPRPRLRGIAPAGLASGGVILGHWVAYVMAVPHASAREQLLAQTGHGYWLVAVKVAILLALMGVAGAVLRRLGSAIAGEPSAAVRYSRLAGRLALLQIVAFTVMEVAERVVSGAPLRTLLTDGIFPLGLALQVLLAAAGGLLLLWLVRVVERLARAFPAVRSPRLRPFRVLALSRSRPFVRVPSGAVAARAPPAG